MDDLIQLVRTYRLTTGLAEKSRLAEEIFRIVAPALSLFVFGKLETASDDVLQETLKGIATGLSTFRGNSSKEFYGWCHQIARHKINDYLRKKSSDRMQPMEPALLNELFESIVDDGSLSAADKIDLDDAMKMLTDANPECREILWQFYVIGLGYGDIAAERDVSYDAIRMRVGRCLGEAQALVS